MEWDDYVREVRPVIADAPQSTVTDPGSQGSTPQTTVTAPLEMDEEEEEDLYGEMPAQVPPISSRLCMRI